jgi:hypothetical protein
MAVYTPDQVYLYVRGAGWSGGDAVTATAVVLAESGGDAAAVSRNPDGGTNVGFFQLDTPGGKGAGYTVAQLQDPALNCKVAYAGWLADGRTFTKHWSTAAIGLTPADTSAAKKAAKANGAGGDSALTTLTKGLTGGLVGGSDPLGALTAPLSGAAAAAAPQTWLSTPANWARIALAVVGASLVLVGLNAIAKPVTEPVVAAGKKAAALAVSATPEGAAAGAATRTAKRG